MGRLNHVLYYLHNFLDKGQLRIILQVNILKRKNSSTIKSIRSTLTEFYFRIKRKLGRGTKWHNLLLHHLHPIFTVLFYILNLQYYKTALLIGRNMKTVYCTLNGLTIWCTVYINMWITSDSSLYKQTYKTHK